MPKNKNILVIPDIHACPDHPNDRADLLSDLIDDLRPSTIVAIGDVFEMHSLCSYDRGTTGAVGRTYKKDIEAGCEFQERMFASLKRTKAPYNSRRIVCEGNHEWRGKRATSLDSTLIGLMSFSDFQFDRYFTDVVEYNGATPGMIEVSGVTFAHYIAGGFGRALSGINHAQNCLTKVHRSFVVGHSHLLNYATHVDLFGKRIHGLVSGCYIDPAHNHAYAGTVQRSWFRGVCLLKDVVDGDFNLETISLKSLKEVYGEAEEMAA